MARPKEFDREAALAAAIRLFAEHGYEGTSTDALLRAMGISRQSLYDTFGDKRRLYLECLQRYNADSVADLVRAAHAGEAPLACIEAALLSFAARGGTEMRRCLGVSSICEFGATDHEINAINTAAGKTLLATFEGLIARAQDRREAAADLDAPTAARFIGTTLAGMQVAARGGAGADELRAMAGMAVRSLR